MGHHDHQIDDNTEHQAEALLWEELMSSPFAEEETTISPVAKQKNPWMAADYGIDSIFSAISTHAIDRDRVSLLAGGNKVIIGAKVLNPKIFPTIMRRNPLTYQEMPWFFLKIRWALIYRRFLNHPVKMK